MFDFDELTSAETARESHYIPHSYKFDEFKSAAEAAPGTSSQFRRRTRTRPSAFEKFSNCKATAGAPALPLADIAPPAVGSTDHVSICSAAANASVSRSDSGFYANNDDAADCEQTPTSSRLDHPAPVCLGANESEVGLGPTAAPQAGCQGDAPLKCDKCDGHHATDACPHFKGSREEHKDAWVNYGKEGDPHQMGGSGGDFVLQSAHVVTQPGDGSCLFHSLNHGLGRNGLNSTSSASNLRHEILDFLQRHPQLEIAGDTVEQWVKWDSNCSVSEYVERMEFGAWGGGIEMAACAHLKEVNIHVYEHCGSAYKRISCFDCESAAKTIAVLYQGRMHYDALVPLYE